MHAGMLNAPDASSYDMSSLRATVSGGSAMPVEVMKSFEKKFDCIVLEGYGLSETSPVTSFDQPGMERKAGSIGVPVRGVEMKLVATTARTSGGRGGEIAIRGENVMKGYWGRDDATKEAIRTAVRFGDMAKRATTATSSSSTGRRTCSSAVATTSTHARSKKRSTSTRASPRSP